MPTHRRIRLLLADDHPVTREGLGMILKLNGIDVVTEAANGSQAVELYRKHLPDVAILDVQMPVMSGAAAAEEIKREFPGANILLFSTFDGDADIERGLRAGAMGYLLKETPVAEILEAIRCVASGRRYLTAAVGSRLANQFEGDRLTDRQQDVLRLMSAGKANKEIADVLGVSEGTVKTHVKAILEKLAAKSRTDAVMIAEKRGLLRS
ncbi:MAG: response regulator transcription factor [Opitutaceae bacterium]|nr:response regulator transcription factor [Opitutaceae bacterium]